MKKRAAFTLAELLVGMGILVVLFGFLFVSANQTTKLMGSTAGKVEQFREARNAFERVSTRISQATLNTYWDYDSPTAPTRYERRSELRFISGGVKELGIASGSAGKRLGHAVFFNAPLGVTNGDQYRGLENLLNTSGYYVEFNDDHAARPDFVTDAVMPPQWRWRLMEFTQPTEDLALYRFTSGLDGTASRSRQYKGKDWFAAGFQKKGALPARAIAENVVAFILTPRLARAEEQALKPRNADESPLAPDYLFDSTTTNVDARVNQKNQLPPVLQMTMVALDKRSAQQLEQSVVTWDESQWDAFGVSKKFTKTADFSKDLSLDSADASSVERQLVAKRLTYRVFTTNIHLRGAKWSREQVN